MNVSVCKDLLLLLLRSKNSARKMASFKEKDK
jgi:hypothetical protein